MKHEDTHSRNIRSINYPLLPGERLLRVEEHPTRPLPSQQPSSLQQILRLTRATSPQHIGRTGPAIASLALEATQEQDTPQYLHLFETVFGRDSLRVAIDLISSYPELARATVLELAKLQGLEEHIEREEELGRIIHEVRDPNDPIALDLTRHLGWGWPYYGSVDATPEFIRTLAAYCQRSEENSAFLTAQYTNKHGKTRTISRALELALLWIENRLHANSEGLLEYHTPLPRGIENQVWKDSPDSYHHADGTIANHAQGIASIEVQVTAYDALIDAAELFEGIMDNSSKGRHLRRRADALKTAIFQHFWTEEKGGYFVLGTDRDENGALRQLKIRTSNMGHTLNSRLLMGDEPHIIKKREAVIRHIRSREMMNASGIRTLASDEVRFRPGAYHNGSVWLWDTHHIAKGLRRHGYIKEATDLDNRILHVAAHTRLFPEYVRGDNSPEPSINRYTIVVWDETMQRENKIEQPPQEIQAWTVAAILATKNRRNRDLVGGSIKN